MGAILEKRKVFDGRGEVCRYNHRDGYYYREHVKGTTRYKQRKVVGAESLDDAERLAFDAYSEIRKEEANPSFQIVTAARNRKDTTTKTDRKKSLKIDTAIDAYLRNSKDLWESGNLPWNTYNRRKNILIPHLIPYLAWKGITHSRQIKQDTFYDWQVFRKSATKVTTLETERTAVNHFLRKWLRNKGYLDETLDFNELWTIRKVRESDLDANPAINSEDWKVITDELRKYKSEEAANRNYRSEYWRNLFWHWCLVCKNCGARPEELIKLRWGEVEIIDDGRFSKTTLNKWINWINFSNYPERTELEDERVEQLREFYKKQLKEGPLVKDDLTEEHQAELGRAEKLNAYLTLTSSKTGAIREVPAFVGRELIRWAKLQKAILSSKAVAKRFGTINITAKTYVFGYPRNDMRPHSYSYYWQKWDVIRDRCGDKLKGNKFALDRVYTPYSMRTTYIENQLMGDVSIALVAQAAGNSPDVISKHYARMDLRKKQDELTQVPFGKKKTTKPNVIKPWE
jgi:hypothetical protein